jgi:hypothetical protein
MTTRGPVPTKATVSSGVPGTTAAVAGTFARHGQAARGPAAEEVLDPPGADDELAAEGPEPDPHAAVRNTTAPSANNARVITRPNLPSGGRNTGATVATGRCPAFDCSHGAGSSY